MTETNECKTLEALFDIWKEAHGNESDDSCKNTFPEGATINDDFKKSFCEDGKFDKEACEIETLFICRESNVGDKPENNGRFWLKEVVNDKKSNRNNYYGKAPCKTDKKAQTAYYNCIMAIACSTIDTENQNPSALQKCAYMNINKRGGKSTCDLLRLENYFCKYEEYILREIQLINPKTIVFLGNMTQHIENKIKKQFPEKKVLVYPRHPSVYSKDMLAIFIDVYSKAAEFYGERLPDFVTERLEWELKSISGCGYQDICRTSQKLFKAFQGNGYLTGSRAATAGLLINFLLGITTVNPLSPHYTCPDCHYTVLSEEAFCGADLPDKHCPKCGSLMRKDGFNIPSEIYLGIDGKKQPDICIGIAPEAEEDAKEILNTLLKNSADINIVCDEQLSLIKKLETFTNVKAADIPLDDKKTLELFSSKDTCAVPEFGTQFVKNIISKTGVKCFDDLIRISGLSHGKDVWENNAEVLLRNPDISLLDVIACRDDVMRYLLEKDYDKAEAYTISKNIRKGKGLTEEQFLKMQKRGIPQWYAESCNKIRYLFSRAHCTAQAKLSFIVAYYKAHYPAEFNRIVSE